MSFRAAHLAIGLCIANFIYLYFGLPLRGGIGTIFVLTLLCLATTLLTRELVIRFFHPRLSGHSRNEQLAIIGAATIVGLILLLSNPLGVPQHRLYDFLPQAVQVILNLFTITVTGGLLVLLVLLGVIGTNRPLRPRFLLVAGFFLAYLIVGLATYDDYGVSTDEIIQRQHAQISLKYILEQFDPLFAETTFPDLPALEVYPHRYYGVAYHLPLIITEVLLTPVPDSQSLWLFRHYVTFLFFYVGTLMFYRLATEKYDWRFGLAGVFLLVTTPRIFAESIYNVKDTVFLSAFTIALYFGFRFWRHKTITSGLLFGAAAAFATNIRVIAFFLLLLGLGIAAVDYLRVEGRLKRKTILSVLAALLTFGTVLIITAPVSWASPLTYLRDALKEFSSYQPADGRIMYLGEFIRGQAVPWHYLPIWMMLTIPVSVLALFALGAIATLVQSAKSHIRLISRMHEREDAAFLLLAIMPVLAAIVLESTLYSGWRHLTFVYAPVMMIALKGGHSLFNRAIHSHETTKARRIVIICIFAVTSLYQLNIVRWMIMNHPYQMVYFNDKIVNLFGGRDHFERDYWRLSVRQGMEYILNIDPQEQININVHPTEGDSYKNAMILSPEQQSRIDLSNGNPLEADYIIDTYRFPFRALDEEKAIYAIRVDGTPILSIYKFSDLYEEIFDDDPIDGRRLVFDSYPFFTTTFAEGQNAVMLAGKAVEFVSQNVDLALPLDAVHWVGGPVTIGVRHSGESTRDMIRQIGCNGRIVETFRVTSEQIQFDVPIDGETSGSIVCRVRLSEPQTIYGAVVKSADALPEDE